MAKNGYIKGFSLYQIGALATLLILASWSVIVLWINTTTPGGADTFEIAFLATLTLAFWVLMPLYLVRAKWSYIGGVLVILGMFVGAAKAMSGHVFYFSVSVYNLSVLLAYIIAVACICFSVQAYRELPTTSRPKTVLGFGGLVLLIAVAAVALGSNQTRIEQYKAQSTLRNIDRELQKLDTLDEKIQFLVDKGEVPSLVAGIVINDALVWNRGYGAKSQDTVYPTSSVTKPIVATAVLQLSERGLIDVDDDVNDYLPFKVRHPDYPEKPITVRMLLTHQSGTGWTGQHRDYAEGKALIEWLKKRGENVTKYDPYPSLGEFLEGYLIPGGPYYSSGVWTSAYPGTKFHYSNVGYDLLGYIVERVTGQPLTDYLQENIFDPLGMTSTGFSVSDHPERQAVPYERAFGVLSKTNVELPLYERNLVGAGGLRSTVPDLARFVIAHLNQGRSNGVQLLEPETVTLMHRKAVSGSGDVFQVGYGIGFNHLSDKPWHFGGEEYNMRGAVGHGGSNWGARSSMWFVGEEQGGYGVILLTNHKEFIKPDNNLYYFAIYAKIQDLLMQEASGIFQRQAAQ